MNGYIVTPFPRGIRTHTPGDPSKVVSAFRSRSRRLRAAGRPQRSRVHAPIGVLVAALAIALACVDASTVTPAPLLTVTVSPHTVSFAALGDTARFTATVRDQHGQQVAGDNLKWTSSDPAVASVNGSGLVRATGNGTATISATTEGATGEATVAVAQVAASVTVAPGNLQFASLGESARLTGTVHDANGHALADMGVTWISTDTSVATVDASGLVRPVANGEAAIRATSANLNGYAGVEVRQIATSLQLSSPGDSILVTDSIKLRASAFDAGEFAILDARFRWESSNPEVASVNEDGYVTGITLGHTDITASVDDASATVSLRVLPYPESLALRRFYEATNGDLWHNNSGWLSDDPLALWTGIHVNEEGRVNHIVLPGNGLIGPIPPQVRHFADLESLHLGGNDLEGPIPIEVTMLPHLKSLDLTYNGITGDLPPEIGNLSELVSLSIFGNELTGAIPPEIGKLEELVSLNLCYNQLNGPIPPEIGNLRRLEYLVLCGDDGAPHEGNRLSGEIPSEIGNLTRLRILELGANQLSGPIPPEIGNLAELDSLHLYSNLLTGLPPEIGSLENVASILLYGNRLSRPIPPEIGNLGKLRRLNLGIGFTSGNNLLSGSIPSEIGRLARMEELDLGGNRLTGSVPTEIGELHRLRRLELGTNHLTGPIPSSIGNLTQLERFAACPDSLQGPIPPEFGKLGKLRELHLCRNQLTGPVPEELGDLASLRHFNLWSNQLTGELPATLLAMKNLQEINWLNNAGLCAPPTPAFKAWLGGLRKWFGYYCAEGATASEWVRGGQRGSGGGERVGGGAGSGPVGVEGVGGGAGGSCWVTVAGGPGGARSAGPGDGRVRVVVQRRAVPCRS